MRLAQLIIGIGIFFASVLPSTLHAISVFNASDIMSSQKAGEPSNHTISFRSFSGINRGAIVLSFGNAVSSIGAVNYTDIDLSYGVQTGEETQAVLVTGVSSLLNTASGAWRVSVDSAAKTISLAFPAAGGVPIRSSDRVKIKIGTHATLQTQGDAQLVNALLPANSIVIDILAGPDDGKIAVVLLADNSIGITASQPIPPPLRSGSIAGAILPQGSAVAQKSAPVKGTRDIGTPLQEEKAIRSDTPTNGIKQKKDISVTQEQKNISSTQVSAPLKASEKVPEQKQEQLPQVPIALQKEQFAPPTIQEQDKKTPPLPSSESVREQTVQESQPIVVELAEPAVAVFAPQEKSVTVSVQNSDGSGLTLNAEQESGAVVGTTPVVFSIHPLAAQAAEELVPDIVIETNTSSIVGNIVYRVSVEKEDGAQIQFDGTRTMVFYYTDEQMFGLDEQSLKAYFWDALEEQWATEETSVVDTEKNSVTIQTTHFSLYSLRAEKKPEAQQGHKHIQIAQAKKIIQEQHQRLGLGDVYLLDERGNIIQPIDGVFSSAQAFYLRACVNKEKIKHKPRAVKISFNGASSVLAYSEQSGCSDALLAPRVLGVYPLVIKIIYYRTDAVDAVRAQIAVGDNPQKTAEQELFATRERKRKQNTATAVAIAIVSAAALYVLVRRRKK